MAIAENTVGTNVTAGIRNSQVSTNAGGIDVDATSNTTVDAITFTSASTVRGFIGAVGATGLRGSPKVVCIGPVTAREARAHGLTVHAVADPHTTDGLIDALARALTPRRRAARA